MGGQATGGVRLTLRVEGALVLIASLVAYSRYGDGWGVFALCFLAPDLSFFGYLAGSRVGAIAYNSAHSYIGAIISLLAGLLLGWHLAVAIALIWTAHIGFDRMLGYGLKYFAGFGYTHLGKIGKARSA